MAERKKSMLNQGSSHLHFMGKARHRPGLPSSMGQGKVLSGGEGQRQQRLYERRTICLTRLRESWKATPWNY